jgi:streptomycin 6-kinase
VRGVAARWELTLGEPYQPGGQCSWVGPARNAAGDKLVLKVGLRHLEADREADGLRAWNGNGAAYVIADQAWDDFSALLLERCEPGTPLAAAVSEPEQDRVIAGLLTRLWSASFDASRFEPLHSMCDSWAASYERHDAETGSRLDPAFARAGIELFTELPRSAPSEVLLATDLHAENVVAAERQEWIMIDPKPHVGDPAYDLIQHMLNCDRLHADPTGLARRLAELVDLDPQRVVRWLFARCVQESIEWPGLAVVAEQLAPVALS